MIKPVYLVWDDEAKRYIHNTTRDFGIYSSKAEEFFSRADLESAYEQGYRLWLENAYNNALINPPINELVDEIIEHDGKPYKEN